MQGSKLGGKIPFLLGAISSSTSQLFFKRGLHGNAKMPLPSQDVLSKLISDYTKAGQAREALRLYIRIQEEGNSLLRRCTIIAALKACISIADIEAGKRIHAHAIGNGHHTNIFVASTLVDMYAKCGNIHEARLVFEAMQHKDVVSWNAIIAGYAHLGMGDLALQLFSRMQSEGVSATSRTFVAALQACGSLAAQEEGKGINPHILKASCLEQGRSLHAKLAQRGFESDIFVASTLVDMYAKCGSIKDARCVFESMTYRSVVSWTAMIMGYAKVERGDLALELYVRMRNDGVTPNARTFVAALKACGSLAAQEEGRGVDVQQLKASYLEQGKAIHAEVAKRGFDSDIIVANTLVDMYSKCGSIEDARRVFENMVHRDVVSWTAMIIGYAQMEMGHLALEFYAHMQNERVTPNARTFVAVLMACGTMAAEEEGNRLLKKSCLEQGRALHAELAQRGVESDIFVASSLVDMYAKCGSIVDACRVFEKVSHRSLVSWNAMITGYAQMDMGNSALRLYERMQREGFTPDAHTFVAILKACGSLASLETGKLIHSRIHRAALQGRPIIATCLIDMYCKCGSMVDAQHFFDSLLVKDSTAWNALIAGYSGQGDSECLFDLYRRMQREGIKPDSITFVSVLNLCSHNGLVNEGQKYFQAMCLDYAILPCNRHHRCMADLLGRAGKLDDAVTMVKKMQFKPDIVTWITMLGACRKWSNVETGRYVFECAVIFDEETAAAYVLMTNIYVSSWMWEESARIEEMRKKARAWKKPGQCKWTDSAGIVHTFLAGERDHLQSNEIYGKLKDLSIKMREEGYMPDMETVSCHILEDRNEDVLCAHNEKLAIACALINTPSETPIRIVKDQQVCINCHKFTALISTIEQRTIIYRDANRFHIFKDGKCSCGEFW